MMAKKRMMLVILTVIALAVVAALSACAAPATPAATEAPPAEEPTAEAPTEAPVAEEPAVKEPAAGEEVVLEFWLPENREADVEAQDLLIKSFEESHPGVKINKTLTSWEDHFTRMQAAAAGGTMPDILYTWAPATGGLYQQGLIIPINDVWDKIGEENFGQGPRLEVSDGEGNYYAVPMYGYLHVLYYRTDWFEEAGLEPPDTIDEFLAAAEALTTDDRAGVQLYTRGFDSYYVMDFFTSNGVEPLAADGSIVINTAEAVEVMQMIKTINDNGWSPDGWTAMNMDDAKLAFMGGSAAMLLNSTSFINTMATDSPEALEYINIVPVPIGKGSMRGWAGNAQFAISSQSEHPDLAKEFLLYWLTPEVYKEYMGKTVLGFIPLYQPVAQDPTFLEMERIKPVAFMYKGGIQAGAEGGPILGAEHGPNVVTFQAYNEMLYAQLAEKIYAGEPPEDVMAFAASELERIKVESE